MSLNAKTVTTSFFWSFLEQGGSAVIALVVQIVLARVLAPEAFGIMAILLVLTSIASTVAQSGLGTALIQKDEATAKTFSTAFWLSLALAGILYLIIFTAAPFIESLYSMSDLALYLRILSLILFFEAFNSIQRSFFQKEMKFKELFRSNFTAIIVSGALGIAAALLGGGIWALILQNGALVICTCLIMFIQNPWHPSFEFDKKEAKELFDYGWKICATGVLNTLYTGLSELVIGKAIDATNLGYYSQGRKWPNAAMSAVLNAIQNVLFPAFASIKNDREALQSAIKTALSMGTFVSVPICFLAAVLAEPIVVLLLTETWLPCVLVFQLACIGYVLFLPQVVNLRVYMALGDSALYLKLQIIKVVTGIVLFCGTAIATKDIYWVAIAVLVHTLVCVLVIDMNPAKRMHGVARGQQLKIIVPAFLLSIISSIASYAMTATGLDYLPLMLVQIVVFAVVYLAGAKLFKLAALDSSIALVKGMLQRP